MRAGAGGVELGRDELEAIYGEEFFTEEELFHDYVAQRDVRLESGTSLTNVLAGLVPGGRLLDVGSAAGFFLEAASRHYDVTGVEFSPFAAEHARREFGHRVLTGDVTEAGLEGELFDVVTMWATIEHMADPLAAVSKVASLTKPGGLFVLSTGDVTGPLARLDLDGWNLMLPPYHLFFFSPRTIDALLRRAGFRMRRITYDGVIAEQRAARKPPARHAATAAGLGNVMTVYAVRAAGAAAAAVAAAPPGGALPAAAAHAALARLAHERQLVDPQRRYQRREPRREPQPGEQPARSASTPTDRWRSSPAGNQPLSSAISTGSAGVAGSAAARDQAGRAPEGANRQPRRPHVVGDDRPAGRQHAPHLGGDRRAHLAVEHRAEARELGDEVERGVGPGQRGRVAGHQLQIAGSARGRPRCARRPGRSRRRARPRSRAGG